MYGILDVLPLSLFLVRAVKPPRAHSTNAATHTNLTCRCTELQQIMMRATMLIASLAGSTAGHGAIVHPRSRNSIDAFVVPLANQKGWGFKGSCANISGGTCRNGQSAFWYSQGCFIGCPECDHVSGRRQTDLCKGGFVGQLPSHAIAVNGFHPNGTAVKRDSVYDIYRHNPWRAPGFAPVADACGLAGGTPWGGASPEEGEYMNTSAAHHGMKGTELPPLPTGIKWTIGGTAEVSWNIIFNHGGGYAYRLCPAEEPLTESCFQAHHLEFDQDKQQLLFPNGSRTPVPAPVFVNQGTSPPGATWSRLPIPGTGYGHRCACDLTDDAHGDRPQDYNCGCKKGEEQGSCTSAGNCSSGACLPCPETAGSDCSRCDNPPRHSWGQYSFPPVKGVVPGTGILDEVKVPSGLKPGKYVLGFRYDCDASAQVWSNCADVELIA